MRLNFRKSFAQHAILVRGTCCQLAVDVSSTVQPCIALSKSDTRGANAVAEMLFDHTCASAAYSRPLLWHLCYGASSLPAFSHVRHSHHPCTGMVYMSPFPVPGIIHTGVASTSYNPLVALGRNTGHIRPRTPTSGVLHFRGCWSASWLTVWTEHPEASPDDNLNAVHSLPDV
jgi:hypothetical protein